MKNIGKEHANLDQQAYQIIKNMIRARKLVPGEKISQERLAQELGISRTPLVSALKYMEKEKLIESKPRKGFFVRNFSRQEMIGIFELREVLEGLAARHAAVRITETQITKLRNFFSAFNPRGPILDFKSYSNEDRRFHIFVTEIAAHEFLEGILQSFNIISFSYQVVTSEGLVRNPEITIGEHLAIIDAVCRHDPDAAETLMRQHFTRSIAALREDG